MLSKKLNVGNQVLGCVVIRCSERSALAASTLIKEDDPMNRQIVEREMLFAKIRTRTAMNVNDGGVCFAVSMLLEINFVAVADVKPAAAQSGLRT